MSAINAAPTAFTSEVLGVVSFAVRVERNGRVTKPPCEAEPKRRSTLTFLEPADLAILSVVNQISSVSSLLAPMRF